MLFNSLAFLIFGAIFFGGWPLLAKRRTVRLATILIASLVFYGFWDPRYVLVLLATGLSDFFFGLGIEKYQARKKLLLAGSLTVNLGALFLFKYSAFLLGVIDTALARVGKETHLAASVPAFARVLPPGISFYTFQSMSYTLDIYNGRLKPTRSPLHFLAFISMFPQLVAGPIVRARDLLPALETHRAPDNEARFSALSLIVFGYFKKAVIADNLAGMVGAIYGSPAGSFSSFEYWIATFMFAIQIYCDFSGYSDIARGLARMMGYEFPLNFDHPYAAKSFREFWQRWHMTLSFWFRDYVYIPLGGGKSRATRNLWITMLLSGIWHGAAFTFVAWGAWHATLLSIERATRWPERAARSAVGRAVAAPIVFVLTLIGWVFFRAESVGYALTTLKCMLTSVPAFDLRELAFHGSYWPIGCLGLGIATELAAFRASRSKTTWSPRMRSLAPFGVALLIATTLFLRGPGNAFIYFQF